MGILNGVKWIFFERLITFIISFIANIFIIRMLVPEDFGIIAIFSSIYFICSRIILSNGIQSEILTAIDDSDFRNNLLPTLFNINVILNILNLSICILIVYALNYSFENLFICALMYIGYSINNLFNISNTLIQKNKKYIVISKIGMMQSIFISIFGVLFSNYGFGVYSLVLPQLIAHLISGVTWYKIEPIVLTKKMCSKSISILRKNSLWHWILGISEELFTRAPDLFVGKKSGINELGIYNRSIQFSGILHNQIGSVLYQASYPYYCDPTISKERKIEVLNLNIKFISYCICIASYVIYLNSYNIVNILFGAKWLSLVPYVQTLMLMPVLMGVYHQLKGFNISIGNIKNLAFIDIFKTFIMILSSILLYDYYQVYGIIIGLNFSIFIAIVVLLSYSPLYFILKILFPLIFIISIALIAFLNLNIIFLIFLLFISVIIERENFIKFISHVKKYAYKNI